jgi:CBS-domain-containing membrane protein
MKILEDMTVKDAYHLRTEDPIMVRMGDEISVVITSFSNHEELRGIFVVDDKDRFLGVITRIDLFDWARVKFGAYFLKPLKDSDKTMRLINLINASTVSDMLRPETINSTVLAEDSLAHALKVMIETDLIILPVIDKSQRIIGNLTISELLNMVVISESME